MRGIIADTKEASNSQRALSASHKQTVEMIGKILKMNRDNKFYLLALNRINGIGPRIAMQLLNHWPHLHDLFQLSIVQLKNAGLPEKLAQALSTFNLREVEADLAWQQQTGQFLLTWCDTEYPQLLKEIPDPPIALYAKGDLSSLYQPSVAIVGTRKPSATGRETARQFAFDIARHQITIISGLALGIDGQAHQGCLDAEGKTIAVMGTGIDNIYPASHRQLAEKISQNGLLLTEFPLKTPPKAGHFPRRNRIICGLTSVILVVEAAIRSGSLITARLALEQNRDVLAIPGSIHNPQTRGCHHLLQQGAKLVTTYHDVLEEIGLDVQRGATKKIENLASVDKDLVKCIGFEVTSIDKIIVRSGLAFDKVISGLASLELDGIVEAVPGGYMRCII